jgi:hypothetical protein
METEIEALSRSLVVVLCISILVISAAMIYLGWLCLRLHREVRRRARRPQVPRNGDGRRLRERL